MKLAESTDLEKRLHEMERSVHRMKMLALTLIAVVVPILFLSHCYSSSALTYKAEKFIVSDVENRTRGVFGMVDQQPSFLLFDKFGSRKMEARLFDGGWPMFSMYRDDAGSSRLELMVGPDRTELLLKDNTGEITLNMLVDDMHKLSFAGPEGKVLAHLRMTAEGKPSLEYLDDEGEMAAMLPLPREKKKK